MFLRVKSSSLTRVQQRRTASRAFSATASGLAVPGRRPVVTLVSSWFCPFAQRAWIALNHRGIAYDWVEALDWNADGSYKKAPVLLAHNPQGLVPTIIGRHGSGEVVTESSICVEFADDFAAAFPDDSSSRSRLFSIAVSFLYLANLIFRFAHNLIFFCLTPRYRVIIAMISMMLALSVLHSS